MSSAFDFSWMIGRQAQVSFKEPAWLVAFGDSLRLVVTCPWRLVRNGCIAISSDDHGQKFGQPTPVDAAERANSMLARLAIQRVEVREGTADILITFERDCRLEILPLSSGHESWQAFTPSGQRVIAQGGGQLSAW